MCEGWEWVSSIMVGVETGSKSSPKRSSSSRDWAN